MVRNWKWTTGFLVATMLTLALAGCVESDQSVVMIGAVIGDGEIEDSGAPVCTFPTEMEDIPIRTEGFINLGELEENGQNLVAGAGGGQPDRYTFRVSMENRLFDSRSVGAVSGGDGGGYQNLTLDKNDILIKEATVTFASENNSFQLEGGSVTLPTLERPRRTNMLVYSGGGISTLGIPLIDSAAERQEFQTFLDREAGLGADDTLTLIAEIQLHGETLAGNKVNSNIIEYPVTMCLNCESGTDTLCQASE